MCELCFELKKSFDKKQATTKQSTKSAVANIVITSERIVPASSTCVCQQSTVYILVFTWFLLLLGDYTSVCISDSDSDSSGSYTDSFEFTTDSADLSSDDDHGVNSWYATSPQIS